MNSLGEEKTNKQKQGYHTSSVTLQNLSPTLQPPGLLGQLSQTLAMPRVHAKCQPYFKGLGQVFDHL